jgi:hypothetical protein
MNVPSYPLLWALKVDWLADYWDKGFAMVSIFHIQFRACNVGRQDCQWVGLYPELCFAGSTLPYDIDEIHYANA